MKKALVLMLLLFATQLYAQGFDYNDIDIKISLEGADLVKDEMNNVVFSLVIPDGFSLTTDDSQPNITINSKSTKGKFMLGEMEKPEPHHVDDVAGHFEGVVEFRMPIISRSTTTPGEYVIEVGFELQACEDSGMCFFPADTGEFTKELKIDLKD